MQAGYIGTPCPPLTAMCYMGTSFLFSTFLCPVAFVWNAAQSRTTLLRKRIGLMSGLRLLGESQSSRGDSQLANDIQELIE